jgi:hypothetical protein
MRSVERSAASTDLRRYWRDLQHRCWIGDTAGAGAVSQPSLPEVTAVAGAVSVAGVTVVSATDVTGVCAAPAGAVVSWACSGRPCVKAIPATAPKSHRRIADIFSPHLVCATDRPASSRRLTTTDTLLARFKANPPARKFEQSASYGHSDCGSVAVGRQLDVVL